MEWRGRRVKFGEKREEVDARRNFRPLAHSRDVMREASIELVPMMTMLAGRRPRYTRLAVVRPEVLVDACGRPRVTQHGKRIRIHSRVTIVVLSD